MKTISATCGRIGTLLVRALLNATVSSRLFVPNKALLLAVSVFLFSLSTAFADSAKLSFNGHSYQRFDTAMGWAAAKTFCETKGAHLATVTSQAENDFISANLRTDNYWLGGTDEAVEGVWKWITGEPWSYTNWDVGEPNNIVPNENYIVANMTTAKWTDIRDVFSFLPMCEWDSFGASQSAGDQFSPSANPNGTWSYGYKLTSSSLMQLFNNGSTTARGIAGMYGWNALTLGSEPHIYFNTTASTISFANTVNVPARSIQMHPGSGGVFAVLRWTAPASGVYTIQGAFRGNDTNGGARIASIQKNGVEVFSGSALASGQLLPFNTSNTLAVGDTLDFVVDPNGPHQNDSTGLTLTIAPLIVASPIAPLSLRGNPSATQSTAHGDGHVGDRMSITPLNSPPLVLACTTTNCPWTATVQYDALPVTPPWITLGATSGTSSGVSGMTPGGYLDFVVAPWEGATGSRGATITVNDGTGIAKTWRVVQNPLTDWDEDGVADEWEQRGYPKIDGTREAITASYLGSNGAWVQQTVAPYGRIPPGNTAPSTTIEKEAAKAFRDIWLWIDEMSGVPESTVLKASAIRTLQASFARQNIVIRVRRASRDFGLIPDHSPLLVAVDDCDTASNQQAVNSSIADLQSHSLMRSSSGAQSGSADWRQKMWRHFVWGGPFSVRKRDIATNVCVDTVLTNSGVAPGLGINLAYGAPGTVVIGKVQQSGTMMHEIGHTLGLGHGGPLSMDGGRTWIVDPENPGPDMATTNTTQVNGYYRHRNHKPTHISVMNYTYQTDGITTSDPNLIVDFDGLAMTNSNPLDETHLRDFWENPFGALYGATIACEKSGATNWQTGAAGDLERTFERIKRSFGPGEKFDCGKYAGTIRSTPSVADLDLSGSRDEQVTKLTEWDRLYFSTPNSFLDFLGVRSAAAVGVNGLGRAVIEPDARQLISLKDYRVSVNSLQRYPDIQRTAARDVVFKVVNSGLKSDTYVIHVAVPSFVTITNVDAGLSLSPGESKYVVVKLVVDASTAAGIQGEIAFTVTSAQSSVVSDTAEIEFRVVGSNAEASPPTTVPPQEQAPQAFSFSSVVDAAPDTYVESNAVSLIGFATPIPIQVRGGEISINGAAYTSYMSLVHPGDTIRLRAVSSALGGDTRAVEVAVGGLARTFDVKTMLTCGLDIDGDTNISAAKDGVLLNRYFLGYRGDALVAGLNLTGSHSTAQAVADFIGTGSKYDVFGRSAGSPLATTDGLVLTRLMLGMPDSALLSGVTIPQSASFTSASAIRTFVNTKCGTNLGRP